ncbi:vWA domain-containing protein [Pontibacillus salipaludis]|uniref:VWFA domain-containing protein n=1 Tax=Pontibacillus salipaludis TaxID=1697394 RepID=A0ABQ1QAF4_9BACI|nr:VWA domain-containing protein [Pontibacillus salipaludis]GGD20267.1 hypothetical protein GCM10011389_29890 [Pontibacillus salipaludis]
MNIKRLIMIGLLASFVTACSSQDEQTTNEQKPKNEEQEKVASKDESPSQEEGQGAEEKASASSIDTSILEEAPELPETTQDLINQKEGKYGGEEPYAVEEKIKEDLSQLDPLPKDADEETKMLYLRYLYSLIAMDYPDPQNTIKKWEYGASGHPDLPDEKFQFKENYNVEVILDASGSMGAKMDGKTRMQLAKESIQDFLAALPKEANVSLRVYGHKGSSADGDKQLSCNSIEQVYSFQSYNKDQFTDALNQFEPKGWTPIADALKESQDTMSQFDQETNTNLIYLVSDGIETCGGDPVKVAEQFSKSDAQPIINIIGFQADANAQEQLKQVARASEGIYTTVRNQKGLEEEFQRAKDVLEEWKDWKEDALSDADAEEVDNSFDILEFKNDWAFTTLGQGNDISSLLYIAVNEEIITYDQRSELLSYADEIEELAEKSEKELISKLETISADRIEELKKSIEEKFSENTEN